MRTWTRPLALAAKAAPLRRAAGACLAAAALSAGCAPGEAVEVTLSVDPAISTEADLAASLAGLTFVLDSEEGLYPPGAERTVGDVSVENADADPELEIVARVPVPDDRLPSVRIERGGLSVGAVDVRVRGLAKESEATIADGQARGLPFSTSGQAESVPFNFLDSLRPPRVRSVFPENGGSILGCDVPVVTVVFSRPMDPASLTPETLRVGPGGASSKAVLVQSSGLVADVTLLPLLSGDGSSLSFDLQVTTGARAEDGAPLDQAGSQPGDQPFEQRVSVDCDPPPSFPCEIGSCPWACGGNKECLFLSQIACVEGVCSPVSCAVECAPGSVCDPLGDGCVADCRGGDALSACAVGSCDATTGLCVE